MATRFGQKFGKKYQNFIKAKSSSKFVDIPAKEW